MYLVSSVIFSSEVDIPVVNNSVCQEFYMEWKGKDKFNDGMICAGGERNKDSCQVSLGTSTDLPLMLNMKKHLYVHRTCKCGSGGGASL